MYYVNTLAGVGRGFDVFVIELDDTFDSAYFAIRNRRGYCPSSVSRAIRSLLGRHPVCFGVTQFEEGLILISEASGLNMMQTLRHELGHATAHALGLNAKDESVANMLSAALYNAKKIEASLAAKGGFTKAFGSLSKIGLLDNNIPVYQDNAILMDIASAHAIPIESLLHDLFGVGSPPVPHSTRSGTRAVEALASTKAGLGIAASEPLAMTPELKVLLSQMEAEYCLEADLVADHEVKEFVSQHVSYLEEDNVPLFVSWCAWVLRVPRCYITSSLFDIQNSDTERA